MHLGVQSCIYPFLKCNKVIRGDLQQRCDPGTNVIYCVQNSLSQNIRADTKAHAVQSLEHLNPIMAALSQIIWKSLLGDVIATLVTKHMRGFRPMWQPETVVLKLWCGSVSQKASPLRTGCSLNHQFFTLLSQSPSLARSQENFPHQLSSLERPSSWA